MAPRFNKIMSKMQDEEDVPADIPNPEMYMPEPEREIARPFPPGVAAQEAFDDMLQRRVMDPLYNAGHEDLGAALSAIPSAAHSMIVPQTDLDVAGTIIPLPGVAKLMKQGKFRRIRNAMKAEAPEEVAGIIAKQAGKEVPPSAAIEGPKAEVRAIDEKEMFRKADESNAREKAIDKQLRRDLHPDNAEQDMFKLDQKRRMKRDTEEIEARKPAVDDENPIQDRLDRIKNSLSKINQLIKEREGLKGAVEPPKVDPPKTPKGDPEASLNRFPGIQSQMDVAPSRMDEAGRSFGDVGQSEFMPDSRPMPRFEEVPRRNYVESEMGPNATDLRPPPRSGRAFQEIYMDQKPERIVNDLELEQLLLREGPVQDARDLQKQMYKGRPSFEAEQAKLFPKVTEAVKETTVPKKGHKGGANEHIPTGTRNTQGKYIVKDWAGNEKDYFGSYDSSEEAYDEIAEWLRSKGIDEKDLDLELGEYDVVPRKK